MRMGHAVGNVRRPLVGTAVILGLGIAAAATAQESPPTGSSSSTATLQDIVVTAEKRSESLQKVPLSIVAYDAKTLAETGVEDFSALAARIPGVTLNSAGPGQSSYSIRGIASVGGNSPTTGLYIDDTPILPSGGDGATASIDPDLFDLARVEVLRGPQGTLYGASSMGGTVRFITNQPNLTAEEGAVKAEGSYTEHGGGNARLDAMYNVPLIDDRVALRVVGTYKNFSGFIDRDVGVWAPNPDVAAGFPAYPVSPDHPSQIIRNVNSEELYSVRTLLKIAVTDAFTITPSIWLQDLQMGGAPNFDIPKVDSTGPLVQARPFNLSEAYSDHFELSNVTMTYDLGWGNLLSTTSYMGRRENTPDDETEALEDLIPQGKFVPNVYSPIVTTREFTEEMRIAFDPAGSAWSGVTGAYFNNADRHYYVNYLTPNYAQFQNSYTSSVLLSGVTLNDLNYSQHGDYAPRQSALFTEINYAIDSRWKATAGGRWYDLEYTAIRYEDGWSNGGPTLSAGAAKNTGFDPKAELSYQATEGQLIRQRIEGRPPGRREHQQPGAKGMRPGLRPLSAGQPVELRARRQDALAGRRPDRERGGVLHQVERRAAGRDAPVLLSNHRERGRGGGPRRRARDRRHRRASSAVERRRRLHQGGARRRRAEPRRPQGAAARERSALECQRERQVSVHSDAGYDAFLRADGQYVGESYPDSIARIPPPSSVPTRSWTCAAA